MFLPDLDKSDSRLSNYLKYQLISLQDFSQSSLDKIFVCWYKFSSGDSRKLMKRRIVMISWFAIRLKTIFEVFEAKYCFRAVRDSSLHKLFLQDHCQAC